VAAEADGIVVSSRSSRHERLCEPVFGTPLEAMDGARRMHLATTWFTVAAAAEAAWNPSRFDLQRLTATWPLFWFGVDDKRFSDLALLDQRSATHGTSHAEVLRDCRRIVKLCDELEPRDHADTLALCSFYARLGIHSVHVRQAFSRSTRKQQVTLLASEAERLKELLKTVMHDSLYRTGVSEEQHYLFQHAEILLKRLQRRL
jgi:hypothetical protein